MFGKPQIVLVLGRRGTGKTTLAASLARDWPGDRVSVHDPMNTLAPFPWLDSAYEAGPASLRAGELLLLDEIDLLAHAHGYREPWVREALHYGRHIGLSVIGCARRPANIHNDITALADTVYLGQMTEPPDLDYCVRSWGSKCYQAARLDRYQFLRLEL